MSYNKRRKRETKHSFPLLSAQPMNKSNHREWCLIHTINTVKITHKKRIWILAPIAPHFLMSYNDFLLINSPNKQKGTVVHVLFHFFPTKDLCQLNKIRFLKIQSPKLSQTRKRSTATKHLLVHNVRGCDQQILLSIHTYTTPIPKRQTSPFQLIRSQYLLISCFPSKKLHSHHGPRIPTTSIGNVSNLLNTKNG